MAIIRGHSNYHPLVMARITVEDCLKKVENRYELVLLASERARQLFGGQTPTIESKNKEPLIALREIAEGTISRGNLMDHASTATVDALDFDEILKGFEEYEQKQQEAEAIERQKEAAIAYANAEKPEALHMMVDDDDDDVDLEDDEIDDEDEDDIDELEEIDEEDLEEFDEEDLLLDDDDV